MNRKSLYLAPHLRRRGPARLRLLKEDGMGGAAGGQNNMPGTGVNSGDSGTSGGESNNAGETFDPASFWGSSAPADGSAPNGESAGANGGESNAGAPANLGQQLTTRLQQMSFGDPIFTNEIAEQINQGNFDGVQARFNSMGQNIVRQALAMSVEILRPLSEQIMSQVRSEFGDTLNSRDNDAALIRDFPSAKNPQVAPLVRQVFTQALQNTKGNRELAVKQTKDMLALMTNVTAGDLGINVAPRGSEGSGAPQQSAINWLEELTSR